MTDLRQLSEGLEVWRFDDGSDRRVWFFSFDPTSPEAFEGHCCSMSEWLDHKISLNHFDFRVQCSQVGNGFIGFLNADELASIRLASWLLQSDKACMRPPPHNAVDGLMQPLMRQPTLISEDAWNDRRRLE